MVNKQDTHLLERNKLFNIHSPRSLEVALSMHFFEHYPKKGLPTILIENGHEYFCFHGTSIIINMIKWERLLESWNYFHNKNNVYQHNLYQFDHIILHQKSLVLAFFDNFQRSFLFKSVFFFLFTIFSAVFFLNQFQNCVLLYYTFIMFDIISIF